MKMLLTRCLGRSGLGLALYNDLGAFQVLRSPKWKTSQDDSRLDLRMLDAQRVKGEFFSREEFRHLMKDRVKMEPGEFEEDEPIVFEILDEDELEEDELSIFNKRMHLRHLCNAILHAAKHGGERAWKQLCIGSDFDGLIDPINNCTSCAQYDKLEADLVEMLDKMIREAKKEDPSAEFFESDLQQHVRDIMYENGVRFLEEWFV